MLGWGEGYLLSAKEQRAWSKRAGLDRRLLSVIELVIHETHQQRRFPNSTCSQTSVSDLALKGEACRSCVD